jgi:hypothetical protein
MAKLILINPHSGIIKQAPIGFSGTTFFFGPLPALYRGDFKWFFIQSILDTLFIVPLIIFPFHYNKLYLKKLLEAGYMVKSVEGATIEALNLKLGLELPMMPGR